jgi:uncharacterized membrane protein (UPF0182 family)
MTKIFRFVTVLLGLLLTWDLLSHLVAEGLWFQEVGYLPAFLKRLQAQLGAWVIVCSLSAGFGLGNLFLADRLKHPTETLESQVQEQNWVVSNHSVGVLNSRREGANRARLRASQVGLKVAPRQQEAEPRTALNLRSLLPLVISLTLLLGVMLLHYSKIALSLWHPNLNLGTRTLVSPLNTTPPLPPAFVWASAGHLWPVQVWQLIVLAIIAIALMVKPQFWLSAIALGLSLFFSLLTSAHWARILQYFSPTAFNTVDPLFGRDISFYVFRYPVWQLLNFWLEGLCLFTLVAVIVIYLLSGDSLSQGKFPGFSQRQLHHLYGLSSAFAATVALHYWLERYGLLYSLRGVAYGASYTDVNVQLPVNTGLSLLASAIALLLLLRTIFGFWYHSITGREMLVALGLYLVMVGVAGVAVPDAIQRFSVQPNELARERPYIERSIALTRAAFDLEDIDVKTFNPEGELTRADLEKNNLTLRNIRLWDKRPLLQTNRQLQQIRLYYKFPDAQIDRYTLKVEQAEPQNSNTQSKIPNPGRYLSWEATSQPRAPKSQIQPSSIASEKQQVLIAARELDYNTVPEQAKTWVNKHLVYTHGFGFTLSPVNKVAPGGLPEYYVKNIGTRVVNNAGGQLETSSESIRNSIPIGAPRIYYGEITNTYVMTATKVQEFDYPSGDENVYNTYDGKGGVVLGSWWQRLVFAQYLKDWQMLFTRNFTPQTRLLFRRNINQRIRAIAPFLRYDSEPYLVVADAGSQREKGTENYLYWIVDAYTTSAHYPYSDPGKNEFNYIRNSVKVVIDAYHGNVEFYIANPQDPIIRTWSAIFPQFFKPLDAMPATLLSHIRYPQDFFGVQSERLLTYHMTDPQVFYNREDLWRIPQEIYGSKPQSVEPYYLIMKLPNATSEEFILLLPFTPISRNNLIGWLAARSDGDQYGKLLLYQFPKQVLTYGPEQIEALINQDPVISQQISLWNRQGSRAIQGNLLVIPIERSLLYVEPLYLEAEQNSLPTLIRVNVVYENRIVMAQTLEQVLQAIFQPAPKKTPTIIRPVDKQSLP